MLRGISEKPDLYKYGQHIKPEALEQLSPFEIVKRMGMDYIKSEGKVAPPSSPGGKQSYPEGYIKKHILHSPKGESSITSYTPRDWKADVGDMENGNVDSVMQLIRELNAGDKPITNINTISAGGDGSAFYRALYGINRQMGGLNSVGFLTGVNRGGRRLENMIPQFMNDERAGEHILIDPQQRIAYSKTLAGPREAISPLDFYRLNPDEQLGILSDNSMRKTLAHTKGSNTPSELVDAFGLVNPLKMTDESLTKASELAKRQAELVRSGMPEAAEGQSVGESTARRAMTMGGIRNAILDGGDEQRIIDNIMNSEHPYWKDQFYCEGGRVY